MENKLNITIDEELSGLIPPLTAEEYQQLEANILADGCREPLAIWDRSPKALSQCGLGVCKDEHCKYSRKQVPISRWVPGDGIWMCPECDYGIAPMNDDVLLDGHNRYKICREHNIDFDTRLYSLLGRDAAKMWVIRNQLGRRNLTPDQASYLRGLEYEATKQAHGGQIPGGMAKNLPSTAERLGQQHGVSHQTIKNDAAFARAVDTLDAGPMPGLRTKVLSGNGPPKAAVVEAARIVKEEPKRAIAMLSTTPTAHVSHNSGDNEWYTPENIIEAAREVMGSIDLDPASTPEANAVVKAERIFTAEQDGLKQEWIGNVWMNPPFSGDLIGKFVNKLIASDKIKQFVVLVNNATETKWFQILADESDAICLLAGRVKFWHPRKASATPLQGQAVLYFGDKVYSFYLTFKKFGIVLLSGDEYAEGLC